MVGYSLLPVSFCSDSVGFIGFFDLLGFKLNFNLATLEDACRKLFLYLSHVGRCSGAGSRILEISLGLRVELFPLPYVPSPLSFLS